MSSKNLMLASALALAAFASTPIASAQPPEGSDCTIVGYNEEAFSNLCMTGPMESPVAMGEPRPVCLIGYFCPEVPNLDTEGDPEGWEKGVYIEVVCNQPMGCGCGQIAEAPAYACSPLQE